MSAKRTTSQFEAFARWLAARQPARPAPSEFAASNRFGELLAEARRARDHAVAGIGDADGGHFECLRLLAAADRSGSTVCPEMVTARGFHVALARDEGAVTGPGSVCVLVRSPPELTRSVAGRTAFLWNGAERFEVGRFDADGKAIGTLPCGAEISTSDLTGGRVWLELPAAEAES